MFKGFQNTSRSNGFNGFPALNFQMNNQAYGFSGCTFWLDAAYGLNTQTDLAAVSSWTDRIRGISFNQSTAASQPRLILSDINFNNKSSIDFYDAARFLDSGINKVWFSGDNFTIAFCAKISTIQAANTLLSDGDSGGVNTASNVILGGTTASITGIGAYNGNSVIMTSTVENTNSHIVVINNSRIIIDGVQTTTGTWTVPIGYTKIGYSSFGSGVRNLFGRVSEIIFYNYNMSSSDCLLLSDRLNSKYAIY